MKIGEVTLEMRYYRMHKRRRTKSGKMYTVRRKIKVNNEYEMHLNKNIYQIKRKYVYCKHCDILTFVSDYLEGNKKIIKIDIPEEHLKRIVRQGVMHAL